MVVSDGASQWLSWKHCPSHRCFDEAFCVEKKHPPRASKVEESAVDTSLLQHLRDSVSIIVTDAAASEQLATDLHRGRRKCCRWQSGIHDEHQAGGSWCAHASTRLLNRPFQACSELKCIMTEWCHGAIPLHRKFSIARFCRSGGLRPSNAATKGPTTWIHCQGFARICKPSSKFAAACKRCEAQKQFGPFSSVAISLPTRRFCSPWQQMHALLATITQENVIEKTWMWRSSICVPSASFVLQGRYLWNTRFAPYLLHKGSPAQTGASDGSPGRFRPRSPSDSGWPDKAFAVMEDIRCQPVFIVQNMFFFVHQIPP